MATIDKTGGVAPADAHQSYTPALFVLSNTVDLTGGAITQGDIYQCISVPPKCNVLQVYVQMVTAATGTALAGNIGTGDDADGYDATVDFKGAAGTVTTSVLGTDALAGGYLASGDTIDVAFATATAITKGPKFKIFALCVKC